MILSVVFLLLAVAVVRAQDEVPPLPTVDPVALQACVDRLGDAATLDADGNCVESAGMELDPLVEYFDLANAAESWEFVDQGKKRATPALPSDINWNPLGGPYDVPIRSNFVRDQQGCGSCTIYATAVAIEIWANMLREQSLGLTPAIAQSSNDDGLWVCPTTNIKVRSLRCVTSDPLNERASPSMVLSVLDSNTDGVSSSCPNDDSYKWIKVKLPSGAVGHVTTDLTRSCTPSIAGDVSKPVTAWNDPNKIAFNVLNQVHCLQKYTTGNICDGNTHTKIANAMFAQQNRVRFDGLSGGVLEVIDDKNSDIWGPHRALPSVCRETRTIDRRVPFLANTFPRSLSTVSTNDQSTNTAWGWAQPWRSIYSPMLTKTITQAQHQVKLLSAMTALTFGPVTVTVAICGDMRPASAGTGLITMNSCGIPFTGRWHRVVFVGFHRAATDASSYFILQNSWGRGWRENGFGRLTMAYSSTFWWGQVDLMLVRPQHTIFNPYLPSWKQEDFPLSTQRTKINEKACNTLPGSLCRVVPSQQTQLIFTPMRLKINSQTVLEAPESIVFRNLRFSLGVVKGGAAPQSLALTLAIVDLNGRTVTKELQVSPTWRRVDTPDVSKGVLVDQLADLTVTNPSGTRMSTWADVKLTVAGSSSAELVVLKLRFADIDDQKSALFRKELSATSENAGNEGSSTLLRPCLLLALASMLVAV